MSDVKTDALVPVPQERSLRQRVVAVVKSRFSGPAEGRMNSAQLAVKQTQKAESERTALANFRREVGEMGARNTLEKDREILNGVYEQVVGASEDLLGILSTYRVEGSVAYFRREKGGPYKQEDEEWVHLPRSLPDGRHVVIQYGSRHRMHLVPSFLRKPREVSKDAFYNIRVFLVSLEHVDQELANNYLEGWVDRFGKTDKNGYYVEEKGRYWTITFDPSTARGGKTNPVHIGHYVPGNVGGIYLDLPSIYKPDYPAASECGQSIDIILGDGTVRVDPYFPPIENVEEGKEISYVFDGGKLVLPGQQKTEGTPEYSEVANEMVFQMEEVIRLATT